MIIQQYVADNKSTMLTLNVSTNTSQEPLLSPTGYNTIGVLMAVLSFVGLTCNGITFLIFTIDKSLRSPTNFFIMALCVCDVFLALFTCVVSAASFHHGWVFGQTVCVIEGFSVYFIGLTSMYLLAAISLDRYHVIVKPTTSYRITPRTAGMGILGCMMGGFLWSSFPLFGWSRYTTEGIQISCSVLWQSRHVADYSYIICIFIFCLVVPLCIMVYSYVCIYIKIRTAGQTSLCSTNTQFTQKQQSMERKLLKTAIILVAVFIISWLPYATVSFLSAFGYSHIISPLMATLPALVAKCSGIWNPFVYVSTNIYFRKAFIEFFKCCKVKCLSKSKRKHSIGANGLECQIKCYSSLEEAKEPGK